MGGVGVGVGLGMSLIVYVPAMYVLPNGNDDALGLVLILISTVGPFQHGPDMTNLLRILNRL